MYGGGGKDQAAKRKKVGERERYAEERKIKTSAE